MAIKVFPTKFDIYDDETPEVLLGTINSFDEDALEVEIKQVMSSKDMAELAVVMKKIEQIHKEGWSK